MQPTCPWSSWEPSINLIQFCEQPLCAWVQTPSNTWSNLAYLVCGLWAMRVAIGAGRRDLLGIAGAAFAVFAGSSFFHMSGTRVGQIFDIAAMFTFSTFALVHNIERVRARPFPARTSAALYWAICLPSMAALLIPKVGIPLFALHVVGIVGTEIHCHRHRNEGISYRPLVWLVGLFAVSFAFWIADAAHVACGPTDHLVNGHSLWHVLNAPSFPLLVLFYAQLPPARHAERTSL